jgi:hypothetical protein
MYSLDTCPAIVFTCYVCVCVYLFAVVTCSLWGLSQVMHLSEQEISLLPAEDREQMLMLRNQLATGGGAGAGMM